MSKGGRIDLNAVRHRVKAKAAMAKHGLASPELARKLRQGSVFVIADGAVRFPDERIPGHVRDHHGTRRVIICNDPTLLQTAAPKSLLVVPCTGSMKVPTAPWHFELPDDEPGFTKERVVALPHLIQPILKADLVSFVTILRPATFADLLARVLQNVGALPGLTAPKPGELPEAVLVDGGAPDDDLSTGDSSGDLGNK